jgi:hypothetical protein
MWMAVMIAGIVAGTAGAESFPFDRYQVIIDRAPFSLVASEPAAEPSGETVVSDEPFERLYRLSAILEIEQGGVRGVRVGLIDLRSNENFFLTAGQAANGLELVSADLENEEIVFRAGERLFVMTFDFSESAQPYSPPARPAVQGTPNPREEAAMALRRARYAQPP